MFARSPLRASRAIQASFIATVLLVGACASTGGGDLGTVEPPAPTTAASIEAPSPEPTPDSSGSAPPDATTTVRAYFMLGSHTGDSGIVPVVRQVTKTLGVGAAALYQLLAGPAGRELTADPALYTDIPEATALLGLTVSQGVATVDLSSEFASGGTTSTIAQRYAQVVFTLTQFGTVKTVQFQFDGRAAPAITPTGPTDKPVAREDFLALIPAIWVDQPVWGGTLANPGIVSGLANTFEAQFRLRLADATGGVLIDKPMSASCGTGCVGTFITKLEYSVPTAQWGTLRVYELSAKDGSIVHAIDYPVWLTPKA